VFKQAVESNKEMQRVLDTLRHLRADIYDHLNHVSLGRARERGGARSVGGDREMHPFLRHLQSSTIT
jgi:hypothetical protein